MARAGAVLVMSPAEKKETITIHTVHAMFMPCKAVTSPFFCTCALISILYWKVKSCEYIHCNSKPEINEINRFCWSEIERKAQHGAARCTPNHRVTSGKPFFAPAEFSADAVKQHKARCEGESEEFDLGKEVVHLSPIKVPAPSDKCLHGRNEHGRVFNSENQPGKEHKELGHHP